MHIIHDKIQLRERVRSIRSEGQTIGFVPTMGYLHQGHLSLIRQARRENDRVVASVFVNPTQFGPNEDLSAYPRDTEKDLDLLRNEKTDIAFFPSIEDLYPSDFTTYVTVEGPMTEVMCAQSRPTHFRGVTTIVAKLFHLIHPHRAYFGQKDAQQVAVLRQMVRDLDFDLEMIACPTVREADGLAMSSRNAYLTREQRAQAPVIAHALFAARDAIAQGERRADQITLDIKKQIAAIDSAVIDYVSISDARSLKPLNLLTGRVLIAVAVQLGRARLIDNIEIEV